ncbi:MAG: septal ring lytic transglycosylase RlpA family protein [Bacteroidota bacterium]
MRLFLLFLLAAFTGMATLKSQTVGSTATGLASYFADDFHGSITSYGEKYNRNELVAAHKLFDHNALVRVTNLENNRSVRVRIIDKGPFIQGRIIEVSHRAAELLGMLNQDPVRVSIELLGANTKANATSNTTTSTSETPTTSSTEPSIPPPPPPTQQETARRPTTPPPSRPKEEPKTYERVVTPTPSPPPTRSASPQPAQKASSTASKSTTFRPTNSQPITTGSFADGLYKIELRAPTAGTHGVQIASLKSLESTMQEIAKLQAKWFDNILVRKVSTSDGPVYKIILGPFESQAAAVRYSKDLLKRYKIKGFTTTL